MKKHVFQIVNWKVLIGYIKKQYNIEFNKMSTADAFYIEGSKWTRVENYEDLEDVELLDYLNEKRKFEGELYVITDESSYMKNLGPFKVNSMYIKDFIKDYYKSFGHHLINTDLMILNLQLKLVWIFQHEGVYSVIDFKK